MIKALFKYLPASLLAIAVTQVAFAAAPAPEVVVYSGRSQNLVGPLLETYQKESKVKISAKYGETAQIAATILEEGKNSPADLFFAQDAGALGAVGHAGLLEKLPDDILKLVPAAYRSDDGLWIGISARSRVVAYNTVKLKEADLPSSIMDYTDPKWDRKIGWAPTNGSFQAFVTAMRLQKGEDAARKWLLGIKANHPREYANNAVAVRGVANGEVLVAFVNHYYLHRFLAEQGDDFKARNAYTAPGDIGSLINVAGIGMLKTAKHKDETLKLIRFLLTKESQTYFAEQTFEYPLLEGVATAAAIKPLKELKGPEIDLTKIDDLEGTLKLLHETGVLD